MAHWVVACSLPRFLRLSCLGSLSPRILEWSILLLQAGLMRRYMVFVGVDHLIAIGLRILTVIFFEKRVPLCVFGGAPSGRVLHVGASWVMCSRSRGASIALVKPRFLIKQKVLLAVVPKNLGPTEYEVSCIINIVLIKIIVSEAG